jgi:hypothetical protein
MTKIQHTHPLFIFTLFVGVLSVFSETFSKTQRAEGMRGGGVIKLAGWQ